MEHENTSENAQTMLKSVRFFMLIVNYNVVWDWSVKRTLIELGNSVALP